MNRIDARELTEWAAYEAITGPLDMRYRGDLQAAIIAATVANSMRRKGARRARPEDFMTKWDTERVGREPQSPQDHLRLVQQLHAGLTGRRRTGGERGNTGGPRSQGRRRQPRGVDR